MLCLTIAARTSSRIGPGVIVGGFIPMIVWSGTFDENRIAPKNVDDAASE